MVKENRKELIVSAIQHGTVIDHLPARSAIQVIKILNLEDYQSQVLFGVNLDSKKYGKKDIVKIQDRFFKDIEINKIALVAPNATLIVIKDFDVVEKRRVEIPDDVVKFVKCFNPNCVTNHENITTKFTVISKQDEIRLQCHYCEKITAQKNMVFI